MNYAGADGCARAFELLDEEDFDDITLTDPDLRVAEKPAAPSCSRDSLLRVMVVDHDPDLSIIAELSLRFDSPCEVTCAKSSREATLLAVRHKPDVLLLEPTTARLASGLATLRELQSDEHTARIPVIVVSERAQMHDVVGRFLSAGAFGAIAKPFDAMGLAGQIRRLLKRI